MQIQRKEEVDNVPQGEEESVGEDDHSDEMPEETRNEIVPLPVLPAKALKPQYWPSTNKTHSPISNTRRT